MIENSNWNSKNIELMILSRISECPHGGNQHTCPFHEYRNETPQKQAMIVKNLEYEVKLKLYNEHNKCSLNKQCGSRH